MKTPKIQGYHWQYDGWGVASELLGNDEELLRFCRRLMALLAMEPLGRPSVHKVTGVGKAWGPGVTILQPITDSHIALQTCQDAGRFFLDVFSCKPLERTLLCQYVQSRFSGHGKDKLLPRG